jgi:8-oxo-dGTP diphosphatase
MIQSIATAVPIPGNDSATLPQQRSRESKCAENSMGQRRSPAIALFGTSADPPTHGHQTIIEWLSTQFDQVWVWAADNPFKPQQTSLVHRQAMLSILIQDIQPSHENVYYYPHLSDLRSLHSVQKAQQHRPDAQFTLVVGSDVLSSLANWYQAQTLFQQVKILVIQRPGTPVQTGQVQQLNEMGAQIQIADFCGPNISSTHYRQEGRIQDLSPAIARYIHDHRLYPRPSPASIQDSEAIPLADFKVGVDNVIFSVDTHQNRLMVLLVQRQEEPFAGWWSLPGTLVRQGESLEQSAYRILAEKLNVENLYLEQLYTFGGPGRDPREAPENYGVRYLSVSYFALVRYEAATPWSHADCPVQWYPVSQLPQLAFDHLEVITYGHSRLCNKLEYSPVAFEVLPETFTLNELYQLYCTVLGDGFSDYSNFRTRLLKLGFLTATGKKVTRGAGRPASLYRFNTEAFAPFQNKPLIFV